MESIYYPIYNSVLRVFLAMMIWLTLKKRKKKKHTSADYLADSQRNIGIYKQSLKTIQVVGINYPKLANCFCSLRA